MKENLSVAAWLMAGKATVLKDANDLFVEADLGSNRFVRARSVSSEQDGDKKAQKTQEENLPCFSFVTLVPFRG